MIQLTWVDFEAENPCMDIWIASTYHVPCGVDEILFGIMQLSTCLEGFQ
jgi:hypothetical protein